MPTYEYYCFNCKLGEERYRPITKRDNSLSCSACSQPMELVVSVPSVQVWNAERAFPNLTGHGDGTMKFASKDEYRGYLAEHGVDELSTSVPIYRPHGNKVIGKW